MKISCRVVQVGSLKADFCDFGRNSKAGLLFLKCHFRGNKMRKLKNSFVPKD